jgi:nucleoside-diphosphate-sugar epimerase
MTRDKDLVLITGAGGSLGTRLNSKISEKYTVIALDLDCGDSPDCYEFDISDSDSVRNALREVREEHGGRIASVVHLAAYFDFTGEESPLYQKVNIDGTRNLLNALQDFDVGQFVYTSTMLVHAPTRPGSPITEEAPLKATWAYPESKLESEKVIDEHHGDIPTAVLRIAGIYNDNCGIPLLSHQVQRIYERSMKSHLFSGEASHGQAFVHIDDVVDAIARTIDRRDDIETGTRLLVGESRVLSYQALQNRIGELIHGERWPTRKVPKLLAKIGAWLEAKGEPLVPDAIDQGEKPFIRPFMISIADDHYELDTARARELLDWKPRHQLYDELPGIVDVLKKDPNCWYEANGLNRPSWLQAADSEAITMSPERLRTGYEQRIRESHAQNLWAPFLTMGLGSWLITSPAILGYASAALAASDIVCGTLVVLFGFASLSWRYPWARAANGLIGVYLLCAPLIFWAPTAAAYLNDTLVGGLLVSLTMVVRPPIGVSPAALLAGPSIPPGWDYSPSSWTQRLPIIILAFVGLYVSRYLAAFQLGHTDSVWDPFFGDGTERIITSSISEAWPVSDAGVGAVTYMLEILTGIIGSRNRWRTMPWLVVLFGIMIVPLGAVSIFFIIIQPIAIGTWCTLCLVAAMAMVLQIPYSLDELVATGQFLADRRRKGRPLLTVFFRGDTMESGDDADPVDFDQPARRIVRDMLGGGVNLPWNLLVSALIGVWLMSTRLLLGTAAPMADADHLLGALVITISITAFAEIARPVRFLNALIGVSLMATPWIFEGGSQLADWASVAAGLALVLLSVPRGRVSHGYGWWDRYIV